MEGRWRGGGEDRRVLRKKGTRIEVEEWEEPLHPDPVARSYPTSSHPATQLSPSAPPERRPYRFSVDFSSGGAESGGGRTWRADTDVRAVLHAERADAGEIAASGPFRPPTVHRRGAPWEEAPSGRGTRWARTGSRTLRESAFGGAWSKRLPAATSFPLSGNEVAVGRPGPACGARPAEVGGAPRHATCVATARGAPRRVARPAARRGATPSRRRVPGPARRPGCRRPGRAPA
jgi:hypothetical protein